MIIEKSFKLAKISIQLAIIKELYNKNEISYNEFNNITNKLNKKIINISKQEDGSQELVPLTVKIKI